MSIHPTEDAFDIYKHASPAWREKIRGGWASLQQGDATAVTKASLLDMAKKTVGDRGLNYGKPEDNFERIAIRWRAHLRNRFNMDLPIDGTSVAIMMADMKLARLENDPTHLDSWVDLAGYAACGGEIAAKKGAKT